MKHRRKALRVITKAEADAILDDVALLEKYELLGVDVSLLVENLRASPRMRLKRHTNALRMALAFRQAGEEARRS